MFGLICIRPETRAYGVIKPAWINKRRLAIIRERNLVEGTSRDCLQVLLSSRDKYRVYSYSLQQFVSLSTNFMTSVSSHSS